MRLGGHLQIASVNLLNSKVIPKHVAFIMDGNGRWAQKRLLPRKAGHVKGASMVRQLVMSCLKKGISCISIFAFSTENWGRPNEEISALMALFLNHLQKELTSMRDKGVKLNVIGDISLFPMLQQLELQEPLLIAEKLIGKANYDISVNVKSGGLSSQVEAARLAIARAIVAFTKNDELKRAFIVYDRNMLVADTRRKEPYKPGDSKARSKRQKSYR